jgi:predicted metal-binding membrane protein
MVTVQARRPSGPAISAAAVLVLAAACWAVAAWLMHGMDMGLATPAGSFGFFAAAWVTMMAAMMLPGAAPAIARHFRVRGTAQAALTFTAAYLAVWAVAGLAAYALDRPHGPLAAGVVVIAAGGYELTPVKRQFRRRCREETGSGLGFGLCCIGSTAGLMAMLVALDRRRSRFRPEAAAAQGRRRRAGRAGACRPRAGDHHRARARAGPRARSHVADRNQPEE